jgi:hypothetical protein
VCVAANAHVTDACSPRNRESCRQTSARAASPAHRCGSVATPCGARLGPWIVALALLVAACTWPTASAAQGAARAAQEARQSAAAARRARERFAVDRSESSPAPGPARRLAEREPEPDVEPVSGKALIVSGIVTLIFASAPLITVGVMEGDVGERPKYEGSGNPLKGVYPFFIVPGVAAAACGLSLIIVGAGQGLPPHSWKAAAPPGATARLDLGPDSAVLSGTF